MKVVLDTNVLVSALIQHGPSATPVDAWLDEAFDLITSAFQLQELRDVLSRPRIQKWVQPNEAAKLLNMIAAEAVVLEELPDLQVSPDPDDNPILASSVAGQADLVVSGDQRGLLDLKTVQGIPVVTPRQAVEQLGLAQ